MNPRGKGLTRLLTALLLFFVGCGTASANGVVPLLTAFTRPETAPLTLGLTAGIILFEAWLLRRLFREGTYVRWLRVSAIINVASSLAGSVYLWMFKDSWQLMSLGFGTVFQLFLLTVVVEGALLCLLVDQGKSDVATTILRGAGLNFASYAGLFVLQIGFVFALIGWGSHTDKQRLAQWQDKSVLEGASGYIYAIGRGANHGGKGLKRFDVAKQQWEPLAKLAPDLNVFIWDVAGEVFASIPTYQYQRRVDEVRLHRLPRFDLIRIVSTSASDIRISPDGRSVAVLTDDGAVVAQRDAGSYYESGSKGTLKVFSVETGELVATGKRLGLNRGLAWSADGREVFFVSLLEESSFSPAREQMKGGTSHHLDAFTGPLAQGIYALNLTKGEIRFVTKGNHPELVPATGELWFQTDKGLHVRDKSGSERAFNLSDLSHRPPAFCPEGGSSVMQVEGNTPFQGKRFLTVFRVDAPKKRLIIDAESIYSFRWAAAEGGEPATRP